jgi:hypothetical protein
MKRRTYRDLEDRRAVSAAGDDGLTEPIGGQLGLNLFGGGNRCPVDRSEIEGSVLWQLGRTHRTSRI